MTLLFNPMYPLGMDGHWYQIIFFSIATTKRKKAKSKVLFPCPVCKPKSEVKSLPSGLPQNYSSSWTRPPQLTAQQFPRSWSGVMVCTSSFREYFREHRGREGISEKHGLGLTWYYKWCLTCALSDEEKIEFEWNTGTNVDTKKAASNFPVDVSDYPKSLHMYANSLLDHRVPQTDMTFRHMGSKLIVVSTNQSADKYMVKRTNYILNSELGEEEYPKMDMLPTPGNSWGANKYECMVSYPVTQAICDKYLMNITNLQRKLQDLG